MQWFNLLVRMVDCGDGTASFQFPHATLKLLLMIRWSSLLHLCRYGSRQLRAYANDHQNVET